MRVSRRRFLASLASAGGSSLVLASLPPWARSSLAAASAPPDLIERNDWPEHWETTVAGLGLSFLTANDRFFVRSHFPAPTIDANSWRLEVAGLARTPLTLTLADLRAMPKIEAACTLECAGNGRGLYHLPSTSGTQWERGAVGTALWSGVPLAEVLSRAGIPLEAKHVWFEAADEAPLPGVPKFLRSIPIEKAMAGPLLAHTMNGAPLPRLHGAPLRVVVPGWYGMASTKWVTRIRLEAAPSDNHFMAKGYRYAYPGEDPAQAPPVEELRVKSLITSPLEGARVGSGRLRVAGFAWAGPAGVARVEVSADGGASWSEARLETPRGMLAWQPWSAAVAPRGRGDQVLMARATDGRGEVQPPEARANAGGYGNDSIHRVTVHVGA